MLLFPTAHALPLSSKTRNMKNKSPPTKYLVLSLFAFFSLTSWLKSRSRVFGSSHSRAYAHFASYHHHHHHQQPYRPTVKNKKRHWYTLREQGYSLFYNLTCLVFDCLSFLSLSRATHPMRRASTLEYAQREKRGGQRTLTHSEREYGM